MLTLREGNQITTAQAAKALGCTARQVRRLRAGLRCAGPAALIQGNRGHRSSRRLPDGLRTQILALAGITTMAAANVFLTTTFLPAFNAQFVVPPAVAASAYRPVPRRVDLERLCAFHSARQVALANTVRVEDVVLQLGPGPHRRRYARAQADVVQCLDGSWRVSVGTRLVATSPAPPHTRHLRARKRR